MRVLTILETSPRSLAKLLGRLEEKVYPPAVACGWEDYLEDIQDHGAEYVCLVVSGQRNPEPLAMFTAFDIGEEHLWVSDIARPPGLCGAERAAVMGLLLRKVSTLLGTRTFTAECRPDGVRLLRRTCEVLSETEERGYFDDGETAVHVVARARA